MNINQKKALYESIMKNVAKEVKSALNEGMYNDEEDAKLYSIIIAYNDAYNYMTEYYADALVKGSYGDPDIFVVLETTVNDIYDNVKDNDIEVYVIPAEYDNIDDFAEDYEDGVITMEDLKKQKVYESKAIKNTKAINEYLIMDNKVYCTNYISIVTIEDDYNEGEIGEEQFNDITTQITGKTIKEVVDNVLKELGVDGQENVEPYVVDNNVEFQYMSDEDGYPANNHELEEWKEGNKKLFNNVVSFNIKYYTPVYNEELVAAGLKEY